MMKLAARPDIFADCVEENNMSRALFVIVVMLILALVLISNVGCNPSPNVKQLVCHYKLEATINGKDIVCRHGEVGLFDSNTHLWSCEDGAEYFSVKDIKQTTVCE